MSRLGLSARMVGRELSRHRAAVTLLFVVPTVLYALIQATAGERLVPFQLSATGGAILAGSERTLSLLFMGSTAMCGLMAFLAFVLTWRPIQTDRRLVFEGYRPAELLLAKIIVIAVASTVVAIYVAMLLLCFHQPSRWGGVLIGFLFAGLLYGLLGIVVGVVSRSELAGILAILLLVNVDPGWLQNPVFYAGAHNRAIIDWLPSHHPCQLVMLSAYTARPLAGEATLCVVWLLGLGAAAGAGYRLRLGLVTRRNGNRTSGNG
jgi:hypothetical protein